MKGTWQTETKPYIPRITKALHRLSISEAALKKIPVGPFEIQLSTELEFAYSLALFTQSGVIVVDQLFDNVRLLWSEGRMVGLSGLVRLSVEYWGAIYFGQKIIKTYLDDKDLEKAISKTARLTFSAKTPVKLPWGGVTKNEAYSVMTFIDALSAEHPDTRQSYDFLCEASHPNFLQNTYFTMASRVYDNYRNEAFKTHAHELLDRTIAILETTADGIATDAERTLELTTPFLRQLTKG